MIVTVTFLYAQTETKTVSIVSITHGNGFVARAPVVGCLVEIARLIEGKSTIKHPFRVPYFSNIPCVERR